MTLDIGFISVLVTVALFVVLYGAIIFYRSGKAAESIARLTAQDAKTSLDLEAIKTAASMGTFGQCRFHSQEIADLKQNLGLLSAKVDRLSESVAGLRVIMNASRSQRGINHE